LDTIIVDIAAKRRTGSPRAYDLSVALLDLRQEQLHDLPHMRVQGVQLLGAAIVPREKPYEVVPYTQG